MVLFGSNCKACAVSTQSDIYIYIYIYIYTHTHTHTHTHTYIVHNIETSWSGKRQKKNGQQKMPLAKEIFPSVILEMCAIGSVALVETEKKKH